MFVLVSVKELKTFAWGPQRPSTGQLVCPADPGWGLSDTRERMDKPARAAWLHTAVCGQFLPTDTRETGSSLWLQEATTGSQEAAVGGRL